MSSDSRIWDPDIRQLWNIILQKLFSSFGTVDEVEVGVMVYTIIVDFPKDVARRVYNYDSIYYIT